MERHHNYQRTLNRVRAISEGRLHIKRQIPIHLGPLPQPKTKPFTLKRKRTTCRCREAMREDHNGVFISIPMPTNPEVNHDCRYIKRRNAFAEEMDYEASREARRQAVGLVQGMPSQMMINAIRVKLFTEYMNQFKYDAREIPSGLPGAREISGS